MTLTIFGVLVVAVGGLLLLTRSALSLTLLVLALGLLGGTAAISLPALGGSSIPPARLAMGFLLLRVLLPGRLGLSQLPDALARNALLVAFAAYAAVAAFFLPRIFAVDIEIVPMKVPSENTMFELLPLWPSPQNLTQGFYIIGTAITAVCATVAGRHPAAPKAIAQVGILVAGTHFFFGFYDLATSGTPLNAFLEIFRNGAYAQSNQVVGNFPRVNGVLPEPSSYVGLGFPFLILTTELWLRGVRPFWSGSVSAGLVLTIFCAFSSTGFLCLALYALVLGLRAVTVPGGIRRRHLVLLSAGSFAGFTGILFLVVAIPSLYEAVTEIIREMTVEKSDSESGTQRLFWALQGLRVFGESYGLGIGPGSFRSSSLATAILGSVGIVGTLTFAAYLPQVLRPFSEATLRVTGQTLGTAVSASCAWAAVLGLFPLLVVGAGADPGLEFAVFSGLALGIRAAHPARAPARPLRRPSATKTAIRHGF